MMLRWQIHIEPQDHAAVQAVSKALGIPSAEFVRRAVRRELEQHRAAPRDPAPAEAQR